MAKLSPFALLASLLLPLPALAQSGGQGVDREAMWFAPTAEDWKKPVLIEFQRTWEDALAVSRATGRPILVCVNMDGEIASEHYAGVRYRQPAIAKLYEPYVCVIASVYRHNPRDFDDDGRRILCPRFGSVTCGEHIAIEPILYEKFMDGKRIAPRHIGVVEGREETYDVYYAWDTDSVFEAIREGAADAPPPIVKGDVPLLERVASPDQADRTAVEEAYVAGDRARKRALIEAAAAAGEDAPVGLLRLAIMGDDLDLAAMARRALANASAEEAVDLIVEALRFPMEAAERDGLIAALERLGETVPRAKTIAAVHRGLGGPSRTIDLAAWSARLESAERPTYHSAVLAPELERRLEDQAEALNGDDPDAKLELAEALLARAVHVEADPAFARLLQLDARHAVAEAEAAGASGRRVDTLAAIAAYALGEHEEAYARAERALDGTIPEDPAGWNEMAVLSIFAEGRQHAIRTALRERREWPPAWLVDVHAASAVLLRHPEGTEEHVASYYDFLLSLGGVAEAAHVLEEGLARFPASEILHFRLRGRLLRDRGLAGLEEAYAERVAGEDVPPMMHHFAGYASLLAAEYHRRAGRHDEALAAYDRGIAHYENAAATGDPEARRYADHYVAMAHGGRARVAYEAHEDARALTELLASFEREPEAASVQDGLNISAVDTAKMLLSRLEKAGDTDSAGRLRAALAGLDPVHLQLPAYERQSPPEEASGERRGRIRRGG